MTLMKSFLMPFVVVKKGLGLSNILDVLPTMLPNNPQFENIKNKNIFDPSACNVSYVCLVPLVSFDIVYKAFNLQPLCAPYCSQEIFMFNLVPLVSLTCIFDTLVKLFVTILSFFIKILVFLLFLIFHHPWHCLGVFLLLLKLSSSSNQNFPLFEFLLKMIRFGKIC